MTTEPEDFLFNPIQSHSLSKPEHFLILDPLLPPDTFRSPPEVHRTGAHRLTSPANGSDARDARKLPTGLFRGGSLPLVLHGASHIPGQDRETSWGG